MSAPADEFEKLLSTFIQRRRWSFIADKWANFVPALWPAGSEPERSITDIEGIDLISTELDTASPTQTNFNIITRDVPGLRETVLRESIYLLHKCAHVVGSAEASAESGRRTWALSDGYQGALFGAKAITSLLGIVSYEHHKSNYLLDIWPTEAMIPRSTSTTQLSTPTVAQFTKPNSSLNHRGTWSMFRRVVAVSTVESWPDKVPGCLSQLDTKLYTRQRNRIHYTNGRWIFNDITEPIPFQKRDLELLTKFSKKWLDAESVDSDFGLKLGLVILNLGRCLLKDLAAIPALKGEYALFQAAIDQHKWHTLYHERYGTETLEEYP